ncbi:hypothetical protein NOGI109294_15405 [Nocardiopsis gilva]|uniref:hypothetical protein n=1 Tax=Nocardiopsis gilva TaxID=280236 RepID=UPI000344F9F3|nr:hypothetical protein [Nocardiopsis gilva]
MTQPRRFELVRDHDVTGVSGTGVVALGVQWPDGAVVVRWLTATSSTAIYDSAADVEAIHGHGGHTHIQWTDPEPVKWANAAVDCPHCPDGHTPPTGGSQPWGAFLSSHRDGDGQPTDIIVCRSGGAHVAESDVEWLRAVVRAAEGGAA